MSKLYNLFGSVYLIPDGIEDCYTYVCNCSFDERTRMGIEAMKELKKRKIPNKESSRPMKEYVEAMLSDDEQAQIKRIKEVIKHLKEKLRERKLEDVTQEHIAVILHELRHCFVNHSDKEWPWNSFDFVHQTAVMMEEAGEAVRAANNMREGKGDQMALYNELAQTAAMCLRIMEQIEDYALRNNSH